jgi:hypothetical protein
MLRTRLIPGHLNKRAISLIAAGALAMTSLFLVGGGAFATPGNADNVTLCHATNSATNPYVVITVDPAGAFDGHAGHTGPVGTDPVTMKANGITWGDIIPAFDYAGAPGGHFNGLNLTADGLAILNNGCNLVTPVTPVVPPSGPTVSPETVTRPGASAVAPSAVTGVVPRTTG